MLRVYLVPRESESSIVRVQSVLSSGGGGGGEARFDVKRTVSLGD